jgi:hypothetical protein
MHKARCHCTTSTADQISSDAVEQMQSTAKSQSSSTSTSRKKQAIEHRGGIVYGSITRYREQDHPCRGGQIYTDIVPPNKKARLRHNVARAPLLNLIYSCCGKFLYHAHVHSVADSYFVDALCLAVSGLSEAESASSQEAEFPWPSPWSKVWCNRANGGLPSH